VIAVLNLHILTGRLVKDPELRYTQDGTAVCAFRIAVDRDYKNKDGTRQADFFTVVAWRKQAENIARYFKKGRKITVVGPQYQRSYTDSAGNKRTVYELQLERFEFADSPSQGGAGNPAGNDFGDDVPFSDDVPF
jgi:single-strand DNA-binding protein